MNERFCRGCGKGYAPTPEYWHRDKRSSDGLRTICIACAKDATRLWKKDNPDKLRDQKRRWVRRHPKKARRIWRDAQQKTRKEERKNDKRRHTPN